jgi:hypothetical protein
VGDAEALGRRLALLVERLGRVEAAAAADDEAQAEPGAAPPGRRAADGVAGIERRLRNLEQRARR